MTADRVHAVAGLVRRRRPIRLLNVVHDYAPAIGGSELLFQKIGEGLVARGFEVAVFTSTARSAGDFVASSAPAFPPGIETINGVPVRRFPYRRWSPRTRRRIDVMAERWWTRRWPGYGHIKARWVGPHLPGLLSAIREWAPDVIAATAAPFLTIYRAAAAARQLGVPFAVMPCLHPGDRWAMDNPAQLDLLQRADAVISLTPYEVRYLRAIGVTPARVCLFGGGVDADAPTIAARGLRAQYGIAADEPIVLFLGRKEEGKGPQHVLEAMVRLWQRDSRGVLVLAGASTEYSRTDLDTLIARLPMEWRARVVVRDDVSEPEKWGWLTECAVLAHPSAVESFGLVYLEAWLCGTPVIGGRTGPQASLIDHGHDGMLVRPGDVEELASTLRDLLSHPAHAQALGRAGRATKSSAPSPGTTSSIGPQTCISISSVLMSRRVSAIIVTRNSRRDIVNCLASLRASTVPIDEMIVIDHDSRDGTVDAVLRDSPGAVVLQFLDNPGFGEGVNRGVRASSGDSLLVLNPDATVAPDAVARLIEALDVDDAIAVAVPKIVLAREPTIINSAGLMINRVGYGWDRGFLERDTGQFDRAEPVLAGSGCALLIRAEAFRALDGFDARFFLYYEDIDLCWRAWLRGWRVHYVPSAVVRHDMKLSHRPAFYNNYLDHRNRFLTLLKNASPSWLASIGPRLARFEASSVINFARARQWRAVRQRSQAWNWNLGQLRGTLRRRRQARRGRSIADERLRPMFAPGDGLPRPKAPVPGYRETYETTLDYDALEPTLVMGEREHEMLGLGWHDAETIDSTRARWCCGYGIAFLRVAETGRASVRIKCRALVPTEVSIRVAGMDSGRHRVSGAQWQDIVVSTVLTQDVVRVDLVVDAPFVPADRDPRSSDHRTLGVCVAEIGVSVL